MKYPKNFINKTLKLTAAISIGLGCAIGSVRANTESSAEKQCFDLYLKYQYEEAIENCLKIADQGNDRVMFVIGSAYSLKDDKDWVRAYEWWKKAADYGSVIAIYNLGYAHEHGLGVERDYKKAEKLWLDAAALGDTLSESALGLLYLRGQKEYGIMPNPDEAIRYLKLATQQGEIKGIVTLAYAYQHGVGIKEDQKEAFNLYQMAAQKGEPLSMYEISVYYKEGIVVPKNDEKSFFWMKKSANFEFLKAYSELGKMYYHGFGIDKNDTMAFLAFKNGAERNSPDSMYNLGLAYLIGIGTEKNIDNALLWLEKAGTNGYSKAWTKLGQMYMDPKLDIIDYENSAQYFQKVIPNTDALEDNVNMDAEAVYYLGIMYYHGLYFEEDKQLGQQLIQLSAENGFEEAKLFIDHNKALENNKDSVADDSPANSSFVNQELTHDNTTKAE